jgi:hypothetical protein
MEPGPLRSLPQHRRYSLLACGLCFRILPACDACRRIYDELERPYLRERHHLRAILLLSTWKTRV